MKTKKLKLSGRSSRMLVICSIICIGLFALATTVSAACTGCDGSPTEPACCHAGSTGGTSHSAAASGGMGDVTTGSKTHVTTFSNGAEIYIGDGFSAWISGDKKTLITYNLMDGFKVAKIKAIERINPDSGDQWRYNYDKGSFESYSEEKEAESDKSQPVEPLLVESEPAGFNVWDFEDTFEDTYNPPEPDLWEPPTSDPDLRTDDDGPPDLGDGKLEGKAVVETSRDELGNKVTTETREYDNGETVTVKTTSHEMFGGRIDVARTYDSKGDLRNTIQLAYGSNGKLINTYIEGPEAETETDSPAKEETTGVSTFDLFGGSIKVEKRYDSDGNLIDTTSRAVGSDGKITGETITDTSGRTAVTYYDSEGKATKTIMSNENGKLEITSSVDDDGNEVSVETTYDKDNNLRGITETRGPENNGQGIYTTREYDSKGSLVKTTASSVAIDGKVLSRTETDSSGRTVTTTYGIEGEVTGRSVSSPKVTQSERWNSGLGESGTINNLKSSSSETVSGGAE